MKNTDLVRFLIKRCGEDSAKAFIFRLLRLAIIFVFKLKMLLWIRCLQRKYAKYGSEYLAWPVNGSPMRLNMYNPGIERDLLYNRKREPYANKAFISALKSTDVVVDIGANIGYYVTQEAKKAHMVYAIEPNPNCEEYLKANVCQAGVIANTKLYQMAIGDYNGKASLSITSESNLCRISEEWSDNGTCAVDMATLDCFCADKLTPTVLRMDVEGYEYEIIRAMPKLLSGDTLRMIFMEFHFDILGAEKVRQIASILKLSRFRIASASLEPHPAVMRSRLGKALTAFCDKHIGAPQGYVALNIDDLILNPMYASGQIEWLEIIFERMGE